MKMPFTITWEKITPEVAREFLTHNVGNRKLRTPTVIAYARDMRIGEWLPNHQGFAFDEAGNLIDGQHTAAAVVMSGVTIHRLVARNVPTKREGASATTMDTIDRGAARSIADMLQLGHGCVDAAAVQATCSTLVLVATGEPGRARKMSMPQALAVIDLWRSQIAFAIQGRAKQPGLRSASVLAAVAFARAVNPDMVEDFYTKLVSGEGIYKGTAVFTMRNYLLDNTGHRDRAEKVKLVDFILTAIHLHGKKAKMERCHIDKDGVAAFRDAQKERLAKIEELFPKICEGSVKEAMTLGKAMPAPAAPGEIKLTAYAEDLLRGKAMSEKLGYSDVPRGGGGRQSHPDPEKQENGQRLRIRRTSLMQNRIFESAYLHN